MKTHYVKALDIWPLPPKSRAALQVGQWVTAGPDGPKGRYMGQKQGGTDVVAWSGNWRGRGYLRALRDYART